MSRTAVIAVLCLALASCKREERNFRPEPPFGESIDFQRDIANNAQALSEGQTLYYSFNCVGCHAHGGGGMGPPLMDDKWIYGYEPADIYKTISEGRPNGMPAFGGKVVPYQIWELVAYVRGLSGLERGDVAPGREDHMKTIPPEASRAPDKPVVEPPPKDGSEPPAGAPNEPLKPGTGGAK